ncbi:hypothetical protein [Actinomycetospora cinnamomea]|uniref:hypothetical protein n=1 Tax=Actinomycetospora cinnamomea TaxID=663609 RepID=UPI001402DB58|nr:hypothetical protein [Actinomycetospora cinnamomea]
MRRSRPRRPPPARAGDLVGGDVADPEQMAAAFAGPGRWVNGQTLFANGGLA